MAFPQLVPPRTLWIPQNVGSTNLDRFRTTVNKKRALDLRDYRDVHSWSTQADTASDFWVELFEYQNLKPGATPKHAFDGSTSDKSLPIFPPPHFFPGTTLNFTEHIFQNRIPGRTALYFAKEGSTDIERISWNELYTQVQTTAEAMRNSGVCKGDRVAAVITNCPEAIVACLATLSIGAIFSTSSPDMGTQGIMDRLLQIEPRLVFFESSVFYNGKTRTLMTKVGECIAALSTVLNFREAILIEREEQQRAHTLPWTVSWMHFNRRANGAELGFEQVQFHHPGFIVYSSGTTGPPKCIVHSAAGLLMKAKVDYMMGLNVCPGDTIYQYTTTGWIMWPLLLCGLAYGASIVLYDGSPLLPDPLATLQLVEKLKVTLFGTSARFLTDLMMAGLKPRDSINLNSLRTVSSTGSVLGAEVCEWFYDHGFPTHVHLVSGSGGTDVAGALLTGDPTSAVYAGEIQRPALGMAIDVLDTDAKTPKTVAASGIAGELVCRLPFPSQPVMFWGRNGNTRYREAYFEQFGNGIWYQGDFVSMSPITGGFLMLGRSDGVLNPSGVRFGSSEIYGAIMHICEFEETICVGQRRPQDLDETVILFVKTKNNVPLTSELVARTKLEISSALTPRHVPKYIFQVPEIPYTVNGKKIELAVKQIVSGRQITPSGAVANPDSLKLYEKFFHLEEVLRTNLGHPEKPRL
ncbi:acetoacetate-CoA ligase [Exophiala aquamarina CBS 119918]|uniref:Acetoacetate-CoA ligase n=1 Tax=Exophiala aquamarina CBS 119918 TaxID=1182545 RepID=A0A072NT72_9EURO|nr:acetoacetate-CoA ligase [Exophiala aquamarina CBS 119918]KEF51079.1 acetoacetate-CoA ligase [Exophiala aquamarina CBS 119918]